jgi:hypothetical protein
LFVVFVNTLLSGLFNDVVFVSRVMLRLLLGYVVSRLELNPVSRLLSLPAPPRFRSHPTKAIAEQIIISVFFITLP